MALVGVPCPMNMTGIFSVVGFLEHPLSIVATAPARNVLLLYASMSPNYTEGSKIAWMRSGFPAFALFIYILLWTGAAAAPLQDSPLSTTFTDWSEHRAIQYASQPAADPVADLNRKIQSGQVTLQRDRTSGYLRSLLDALN